MAERDSNEEGASDESGAIQQGPSPNKIRRASAPAASSSSVTMENLSKKCITKENKERLRHNRRLIVNTLQNVEWILKYLKEKNCIQEATKQDIMAKQTCVEKHQCLLEVVMKSSEATYHEFLQILQDTQDEPVIYNCLRDAPTGAETRDQTRSPLVGPAKEYCEKLKEFHKRKLELLAKEKPLRHELTSYVKMNIYSRQQGLHSLRKGFRESVLETIDMLGEPIEPENLFLSKVNDPAPKKVLLMGSPGVGKSMTAYHFLSKCTYHNLWKDIHFIVFIILRELNHIICDVSFQDILFNYYGPPSENKNVVLKYLQKNQGHLLFILDGYDEADGLGINITDGYKITFQSLDEKTKPQQLIFNLIRGDILPDAKVLVTGRPHVLEQLGNLVNRKVELVGLQKDNLIEMTERELCDHPDLVESVTKYFDDNPNVVTLCSVPVNAKGFLEHVKMNAGAQHIHKSLPKTKAGLLFMIALNLLRQHDKLFASNQNLHASDILHKRKHLICLLAKAAYGGLFGPEGVIQLFDIRNITEQDTLKNEIIGSGLMSGHLSAIRDLFSQFEKVLLQFDHFTIQEFFGALNMSQLPLEDLKTINEPQRGEWDMILQLCLGAMGDQQCQGLLSILYPDTTVEDYNKKTTGLLEAVWSSPRHHQENGTLYSIHLISESQQFQMADVLLQKSMTVFKAVNLKQTYIIPTDCYPIGDFLSKISEPCHDLVLSGSLDETGLNYIIQSKGFQGLTLITDLTEYDLTLNIIGQAINTNIIRLSLTQYDSCPPLTCEDWAKFQPPHNTTLQCLELSNVVNDHTVQITCDKLHSLCALQALQLVDSTLTDITPLSDLPKTIKYLTLRHCGLNGSHLTQISDMVVQNGLVWLDVSGNDIGDNGAATLAQCMENSCNVLQVLLLQRCQITSSGTNLLFNSLKGNSHLKVLDLPNDKIGERVDAVVGALHESQIEEIYLVECGISAEGGRSLLMSIKDNSTITCLDLSSNTLNSSEFSECLGDILATNKTLIVLGLGDCGITDETLGIISKGLKHNTYLKLLDLSYNSSLTGKGISELLTQTQLQALCVAGCELGMEGWREVGKALCANQHITICHVGDEGDNKASDLKGLMEELIQTPISNQMQHLLLAANKHVLSSEICQLENTCNIKVSRSYYPYTVWLISGLAWHDISTNMRHWHSGLYTSVD